MKTNVILTRKMGEFNVLQRTGDGFFNASSLLAQWNSSHGIDSIRISRYLDQAKTIEFIKEVKDRESLGTKMHDGDFQPIIIKKGRMTKNGKTKDEVWMHPFIFVDFCMWLNPVFKYDVIKFVYDQLIDFRKQAGDSYKRLATNVQKVVGGDKMKEYMPQIAKALNWTAFNDGNPEARNRHGMEDRVNDLIKIQDMISNFIEYNMLRSYSDLIKVLRIEWAKRWSPKVLRDREP